MKLLAAAAALSLTAAAPAAHALTWTTQLDWSPTGHSATSYGTVTVTEVDANDVQVKVALSNALFVDTGGHFVFAFNLLDTPNSTVTVDPLSNITAAQATYQSAFSNDPTTGSDYANSPFGNWDNAWVLNATGGSNTLVGPFIFDVHNANGITFAGTAPSVSGSGQLLSTGCTAGALICNTFDSNDQGSVPGSATGGWWFSADTSGSGGCGTGATCVIAGRDAFVTTGVPEPAAWGLMILGFGGVGAMMRRSRRVVAIA